MDTRMSETTCILVVSPDPVLVSTAVDALRNAGHRAMGSTDPWESIMILSQQQVSLIIQDPRMSGLGAHDFGSLLEDDPVLREIPRLSSDSYEQLIVRVQNLLNPRLPAEEPSSGPQTRFVRRRRPLTLSQAL